MTDQVRALGEPGSLYARCGGVFGVAALVDRLMDAWMEDSVLNANSAVATWHRNLQRCGFKFLVTQQVCSYAGGPQKYSGRPMASAHKHLGISSAEWARFMEIFNEVISTAGVDSKTISDVAGWFESLRTDVVVEPGEAVPAYNPEGRRALGDTLYARLGGIYALALFADRLVDGLLSVGLIGSYGQKRNDVGLKYLFTELVCHAVGGPELITCESYDATKLLVPESEWNVFMAAAEMSADHLPSGARAGLFEALERNKGAIVDPNSSGSTSSGSLCKSKTLEVKDVQASAAGKSLDRATLAARHANPGLYVAARLRVFGDPRTLYGCGGGVFGLARLSCRLMDVWMADPVLNENKMVTRWHESRQRCGFKFLVTQILGYLTGGPQRYIGRSMEAAHKHLAITSSQWDQFIAGAEQVFHELKVNERTRKELLDLLGSFRSPCLLGPGELPAPDPGPAKPASTTAGTLFHSLGGVYPIAEFVDRLVDLVLEGSRVHIESHRIEDVNATRHPPGLKYMLTELVCSCTGGPVVVTSKGFDEAKLGVQEEEWQSFLVIASEAAEALSEIWPEPSARAALLSHLKEVKAEICVGSTASADASHSKVDAQIGTLRDAGFGPLEAHAALEKTSGDMQGALELLKSGWRPEESQGLSSGNLSRCPFAPSREVEDSSFSSTLQSREVSESMTWRGTPHWAMHSAEKVSQSFNGFTLPARVLGSPLQMKLDDLLDEDPDLCCPVSLKLFVKPVTASDGFDYEQVALKSLLRSAASSPMSREPMKEGFAPAKGKKQQALEFRKVRSEELLSFAKELAEAGEQGLALQVLERVGEYLQVLRPRGSAWAGQAPALANQAAELWETLGHPVPPELLSGALRKSLGDALPSKRDAQSAQGVESAGTDSKASDGTRSQPSANSKDFQKRLDMILQTEETASAAARKLHARFGGNLSRLPEVLELLEEKWGFPRQLAPLLWTHLRRATFRSRGQHAQLDAGDAGKDMVVNTEEWVEAFVRWLQALRSRCGEATVSRQFMVKRKEGAEELDFDQVYFLGKKLGEGAYGEVYLAYHKALRVERVVKVLKLEQASAAAETVQEEVKVLKDMDFPHIVRIYETFEMKDSMRIVMDYAGGGDLASVIKVAQRQEKQLEEEWCRVATQQSVSALGYMHSMGVIHADIKPANVMLLHPVDLDKGDFPHVVLVDFGLAELFEERREQTAGGPVQVKGTPAYLAPEGFEGKLSEKSDMWAIGVMAFEMLLGERPFSISGGNMFVLWSKIAKTQPPLEKLPPLPREVVGALLEKDPSIRPTAVDCLAGSWFKASPRLSARRDSGGADVKDAAHGLAAAANVSYFRRAAMFCIASELSMKNMKEMFEVFSSLDSDGSGSLTKNEIVQGLAQLNISGLDPATLVASLDMDQDDRVSYTEFMSGMLSAKWEVSEQHIESAFRMLDLDGDGYLTRHEVRIMMSSDGPLVDVMPDGQTIDDFMSEVGNREGRIDYPSFRAYLTQARQDATKLLGSAAAGGQAVGGGPAPAMEDLLQELDATGSATQAVQPAAPQAPKPELSRPTPLRQTPAQPPAALQQATDAYSLPGFSPLLAAFRERPCEDTAGALARFLAWPQAPTSAASGAGAWRSQTALMERVACQLEAGASLARRLAADPATGN